MREQRELLRGHLAAAELSPPPTEAQSPGTPRSRASAGERGEERDSYEPFVGAMAAAAEEEAAAGAEEAAAAGAAATADDYVPFGPSAGAAQAGAAGEQDFEPQPTAPRPLPSDGVRGGSHGGPAALVDPNEAALAAFDLWGEDT